MSDFNYEASAELYSGTGNKPRQKVLKYRRFERAAEAIRHVMEDLPPQALAGCSLDVAEESYIGKAIAPLYESPRFPLPRRVAR